MRPRPLATSCASVDLTESGALSSYDNLGRTTGQMAKSRSYVDKPAVTAARTVRILPASFSASAAGRIGKAQDRDLVSNALDRAICVALSDRYVIVAADQPADLTVRNVITGIIATNKAAAGVSTAVSLGSSFVLPVSVPRLPFGLGGLAVEGEVTGREDTQLAAMVWAKGANAITNKPRLSEVGDAYALAAAYGDSFSKLLIKGQMPAAMDLSLPSGQRINAFFGGKPKYAACDSFGRAPGVPGMVAGMVGAPPEWTDSARGQARR
ncbi:DUF3313 domain-containing protein [Hoeflea ulvae]|uniref:DUF3313 domain-containing protein n=1 Tax=Hoeflea ulvae TaxID=2983764 RepID=A0ABT3YJV8_9HYPH|nr:DUF3313 domain-containing protein [Hoeflea ulvae]MCY0096117.1 DUF3313 domain-containing protein [Hoeflea ulvae]